MFKDLAEPNAADQHMKERMSLVELAFRDRETELKQLDAALPGKIMQAEIDALRPAPRNAIRIPGTGRPGAWMIVAQEGRWKIYNAAVEELNERLRRAGAPLHYHNGFLQISEDELIQAQIATPFWKTVSDAKWANVDTDMKEAVDRRDDAGRDPAFYATRALESTIKIISDEKGWSTGNERGAANYIDNLVSRNNGRFIEVWECDALKQIFSEVRNLLGHGPGSAPMPQLSDQQTSWTIENCMSWIRSLVQRM